MIGIRHGEKMYETLLTKEEAAKAEDMGNFYRVPADNRDLNYDKYFKEGDTKRALIDEFNSNNTRILNLEETKEKIASLTYIQNELNGIPNLVWLSHTDFTDYTDNMTNNELTYEIRGAIFDVYNELGPGLLESVYEEALVFELKERGLKVERQMEVPIRYKGNELKTPLRLDLLIENTIIVELKSVEEMKPVFAKQLLTYLRLLDKRVGLLVNFSANNIREGITRIVN